MPNYLRSTITGAQFRAEDDGRVSAVLSTAAPARDGAIIEPSGWQLDNYRRNPVVLYSHQDGGLPVGKSLAIEASDTALVAVAQLDTADPFVERLLGKIRRGLINATSVRWLPLKTERRTVNGKDVVAFLRQELLEWSFVTLPSDPTAMIVRALDGEPIRIDDVCGPALGLPARQPPTFDPAIARLTERMRALTEATDFSGRHREIELLAERTGRTPESIRRALFDGLLR